MKSNTIRTIFTKQNQDSCNAILNDLDNCLSDKFTDASATTAFCAQQGVKVFTSTIEQQKTHHQVKFNDYAQRIAKRCFAVNPNDPDESFYTSPSRMSKRRINLSYANAVATPSPRPASPDNNVKAPFPSPNVDIIDISLHIPTPTDENSSRLADLESNLVYIQSKRDVMQSDHKQLCNEFQRVLSSVIQHSKEIRAMQSDARELMTMMQESRNDILPNTPICHHALPLQPYTSTMTFHPLHQRHR
jgi:hypothetical protein